MLASPMTTAAYQNTINISRNDIQAGRGSNIVKTGSVERTNTGVLDEFRKSQLRNQVIQHTDQSLPPLTNRAEEMIKSGRQTPIVVPMGGNQPNGVPLPPPARPGPK